MTDTSIEAIQRIAGQCAVEGWDDDAASIRALLAERDDLQARRKEFEADNIRLGRALGEMQGHTFFCQDPEGVLRRWYPPEAVPMFEPGEVVEISEGPLSGCKAEVVHVMHDDAPRAVLGEIGNQIHNIACELHGNDDLQDRLAGLACRIWDAAKLVSSEPPAAAAKGEGA